MGDVRSFGDADRLGFRILDEEPPDFLAIGVVARPWQIKGGLQRLDGREEWLAFAEPGYAKISWTFRLEALGGRTTMVSTETRVRCTDATSRRRFNRYWAVVGPFSSLIRKELLRVIKREAEAA